MNGISSVPYGIESWDLINYNPICSMIKSHDSMPWKKSSTLRAMGWWNRSHFKIVVKSSRGWIPGPLKIRWWCCRSAWVKPDFRKSSPLIFFAAYLTFYWWDKVTGFNSIYIYIHIHILDKQHASQVSSSLQGPMGLIFQKQIKKCHEIYPLVI